MESIFLQLLNMSMTAGWLVLAVLVLRLVFRHAPRWIHCALWALVAVRLICPISIESDLSLIPSAEPVPVAAILNEASAVENNAPVSNDRAPVVNVTPSPMVPGDTPVQPSIDSVSPALPQTPEEPTITNTAETTPATAMTVTGILTLVWLVGAAVMLLYAVVATLRLKWRVREAVRLRENVFQCDGIVTPFILGVVRPRIYLPTTLSEMDAQSVISHELAHIHRRDHWWKPLGFVLLAVYWFHPLLWVGYVLLCRDIEAACDEKVIRDMDVPQRKAYSETILACSAPRHLVTACPLAFGETAVKSRIKAVLNYKKPAFWVVLVAVIAAIAAAVCLLTNPRTVAEEKPADTTEAPSDVTEDPMTEDRGSAVKLKDRFVWDCGYLGEEIIQSMYVDQQTQYSHSNLPVLVLNNTADLEELIATYYDSETEFTGNFTTETSEVAQMRERYTEAYFEDSVVLAVYYEGATYMYSPEIVDAQYADDGKKLTVLADVYEPSFVNDAMGGWFMLTSVDRAAVEGVTTYTAAVRAEIPEDSYVALFEKTRYMHQLKESVARETWRAWLSAEEWDALYAMVPNLDWGRQGGKALDSLYIGAINLAGETYYVSSKFDILSTKKETAFLTAEQSAVIRNLYETPRNGSVGPVPYLETGMSDQEENAPAEEYVYLYGRYIGHNKAERYLVLQTVWAENADLVGKQVVVSLEKSQGKGLPDKGAMIEVTYDGTVGELNGFPKVIARGYSVSDELFTNFNDPGDIYDDKVGGNFTGKVMQVTDGRMLMECYDKSLSDTVWVNYRCFYPEMKPEVGDEYEIAFADGVFQTTPPHVTGERITAISYATQREDNFITESRAIEIASKYWKIKSGDKDPETGRETLLLIWEMPTREAPHYRVSLRRLINYEGGTGNFETIDTLYIHAVTGEIALPDGKQPEEGPEMESPDQE